ncbi:helix-turn-helix transcriptional regulator [Bifidobacterium cuniculi]|uniref:The helix-turn-helix motif n=1 Tax=Bifidobacterium cuniculi TaxID=1688 RepID=A0A087AFH9_9BIFI|nr:helix-turn-helix transcriptional regulator [Bifidobacterium cuniculi]KFI57529.1 the helix-turn-helix motif [Bifidobacterium cuniculi]
MSLKDLRAARGLTQRELANRCDVSHVRIADWERGARDPRNMSLDTAIRLADALHVRDLRRLLDD